MLGSGGGFASTAEGAADKSVDLVFCHFPIPAHFGRNAVGLRGFHRRDGEAR